MQCKTFTPGCIAIACSNKADSIQIERAPGRVFLKFHLRGSSPPGVESTPA